MMTVAILTAGLIVSCGSDNGYGCGDLECVGIVKMVMKAGCTEDGWYW